MPKFFSQNGEDCLLWELFKNKATPGYYVEVGALDGVRFSNTYTFELEGWHGICIEAHPDYIKQVRLNRPNSINVFAAAGDQDKTVTFYTNARGSLSTIDPTLEEVWKEKYSEYFSGFVPVEVPMKTLSTILNEAHAPYEIDFISIDVEGAELLSLKGLDFSTYHPRIILVEALEAKELNEISAYLSTHGYLLARSLLSNYFFCNQKEDRDILAEVNVDCYVTHLPHSLDKTAQPIEKHIIMTKHTTAKSNILNRFLNKVKRSTKRYLKPLLNRSAATPEMPTAKRILSPIYETGFHGDQYLIDFVASVIPHVDAFIETGTNVGTTAKFMGETYPELPIYSCEPDSDAFQHAVNITKNLKQVYLYNMLSPDFLYRVQQDHPHLNESVNFYWLDAHEYGYKWPLADEIRFITTNQQKAVIMIDDAEVPGHPEFKYTVYDGQECNVAYVEKALASNRHYQFIHPNYTVHTSKHHPLVGVIIIAMGLDIPVSGDFSTRMVETHVE
jgi:FkbM family methyltransferase